jgi:choloylglycine hydrolase
MCTTFIVQNDHSMLLGQNYDFYYGHGLIVVGNRDVQKEAFKTIKSSYDAGKGLKWTVNYGSVTFTQFGRELPMSGMNEKGLVVAMMYHDEGEFPREDDRLTLNELQWIQYQLDQYATVEEVILHLNEIRLEKVMYVLHYSVADAEGNAVLIEFIEGKAQVIRDEKYFALSNSSFKSSKRYAKQFMETPISELSKVVTSHDRFTLAYRHVERINTILTEAPIPVEEAFFVLKDLSVSPSPDSTWDWIGAKTPTTLTYWSIVFDLKKLSIYYKDYHNNKIRTIDLNSFNFAKTEPTLCLRIDNQLEGGINSTFVPYTTHENKRIIELSYKPISDIFPIEEQLKLAVHPDKFQ